MSFSGACTILPWYDTHKVPYIQASPSLHRNIRFVHASSLPKRVVSVSSRGKPYSLYPYCIKISATAPTTAGTKNRIELAILELWKIDPVFQAELAATGNDIIIFEEKHWFWGRWRMNGLWVGRNELGELLGHVRDMQRLAVIPRSVSPMVVAMPSPRQVTPMPSPMLASRPASPLLMPSSPMLRTPPASRPGSPLAGGNHSPRRAASPVLRASGMDFSLPGPVPIPPSYASAAGAFGPVEGAMSPYSRRRAASPAFSEPPPSIAARGGSPLPRYQQQISPTRSRFMSDNVGIMQAMTMQEKQQELEVEMQKTRMLLALRDMKARELRQRLLSQQHMAQRPYGPQLATAARPRRYSTPVRL